MNWTGGELGLNPACGVAARLTCVALISKKATMFQICNTLDNKQYFDQALLA